ncbi:MAG: hypothetical protein WKF83_15415 [Nocardioidaceae bacterium]
MSRNSVAAFDGLADPGQPGDRESLADGVGIVRLGVVGDPAVVSAAGGDLRPQPLDEVDAPEVPWPCVGLLGEHQQLGRCAGGPATERS